MNKFKFSLRAKLIGLVLSVMILMVVGTIFNLKRFEKDYSNRIEMQMVSTAQTVGKAITAQLFVRYGDAQAFAVNRSITSLNKEMIVGDLDNYIKLYGIYDLILVIDKSGKLVAANSASVDGIKVDQQKLSALDYSKYPWFENALKGSFTEDKDNKYTGTYVEGFLLNPVIGEAYGEAKHGSIFSAQIKDSKGEVIGVLVNHAGARWFESEVLEHHSQMVSEKLLHSEIMIFNDDDKLMSHSEVDYGTKKISFDVDPKVILKSNLEKYHVGLGEILKRDSTGYRKLLHETKKVLELVAFHNVANNKSIAALGWTVIVEDAAEDAYAEMHAAKFQAYTILIGISFFGVLLALWAGIIISKSVAKVTMTLAANSEEVSDASHKIASSSTELSETATEQAAALQETVAAIDEISAMVQRNSEAAQKSKEVSQSSREAANKGREIVTTMIQAIGDIDRSNDEVSVQMADSNRKLSEITNLINDISTKTKVINEIVFQTKLLSFNASVEAARAGEAGKGFAVVAEEVGNLAQMSGNAAKEISALLEQSVQKVNVIVSDSKSQVDRLMLSSKEKVKHGSRTAQDCNQSLEEIISQVQTVDSLVSEIAVASQEQSTGIREVSRAMGQMEQATQQNSTVAHATSVAGEQIRGQSEVLNNLVRDLSYIVSGQHQIADTVSKKAMPSKTTSTPSSVKRPFKVEASKVMHDKEGRSGIANILKFSGSKKVKTSAAKPVAEKKVNVASGADFVPSGDDPGFSE